MRMTYQANYSFFVRIRDCVCVLYTCMFLYPSPSFFFFFSCGSFPSVLACRRQSSTDRMGFQRCYYYLFFPAGAFVSLDIQVVRYPLGKTHTPNKFFFLFKFVFLLLPFTFNNNE